MVIQMYVLMVVGTKPIKVRINTDEKYFEIQSCDFIEPMKLPYDDPYDIIKVVEQYTVLSQVDIQKILGVCSYGK